MIPLWRIFLDVFLPHLIHHAECVLDFFESNDSLRVVIFLDTCGSCERLRVLDFEADQV